MPTHRCMVPWPRTQLFAASSEPEAICQREAICQPESATGTDEIHNKHLGGSRGLRARLVRCFDRPTTLEDPIR